MKKTTAEPSLVVKEIAKRRLAEFASRQLRKPALLLRCVPVGKSVIPKPIPKKKDIKKERELQYDIRDLKNPFKVPAKDRFFSKAGVKRIQKPTDIPYEEVKTVRDNIHDQFFKVIDGRPLKPPVDIKKYMRHLRQVFLLKADAAYINDQIIKLDFIMGNEAGEMKIFKNTYKLCQDTVLSFKEFLAQSFREAKQAEFKQAEVETQIAHIKGQLKFYSLEYMRLINLIFPLSDKVEVLLIYKKFLDEITPIWWRIKNRIGFCGRSMNFQSLFIDYFEDKGSLEDIKKSVITMKTIPIKIYFEKPHELMRIFDDMHCYCLRYIQLATYNTSTVVNSVMKCKKYFEAQINKDVENGLSSIEEIEKHVKFMEEKVEAYKDKFYKILNNEFRETTSSHCALKLFLCVQYANTKSLGITPDPKDSLYTLMAQIERKYEDLMRDIDNLDNNVVNNTTKTIMKKDKEMMRKAYEARRLLREWTLFEKSIKTSFEPPRYRPPQPKIAVWQRK